MADYGGAISLSHQPPTSSSSSSDHNPPTTTRPKPKTPMSSTDNSSIKKPRGRPPGSKNKPKPPIVITKENESSMKPVVIEISAGNDVVDTLLNFARKRHVGLTVLSGSGSVSNVTLRHPMSHSTNLSLHGPFSLVSLSGSFLANTTPFSSKPLSSSSSFGICLAGAQGQVFGGIVGGKVTAASLVVVVAATFINPVFHRLPSETAEDDEGAKPAINTTDESPVAATTTSSATPMAVCIYNAPSPPDHAMPWGPSSRSSY
ncbi:AT-hook motif nuclear-localized protein 17-like [Benincasa hispida]|uniref:AT-hook motif nuclear-localized protein 17-like n=1 Tax=Benincasa hispida TaxID=102211 RepID=UPI0019024DF8|nr:AT-hook motif nuclear-localized protein 17-like [Benincasa hispida]